MSTCKVTMERNIITPYAKLLLDLTHSLSETEFSQIRMALSADNYIKTNRQASIKNIAELFEYMNSKRLIMRSDLQLLYDLMGLLKREDLKSKIEDYELAQLADIVPLSGCCSKPVPCEDATNEKAEHKYSFDEDALPGSQDSMRSLSDDEKLQRGAVCELTEMIEFDDVQMSIMG